MDFVLPGRRETENLIVRLRVIAKLDPGMAQLFAHLGWALPTRNKILENVVRKTIT